MKPGDRVCDYQGTKWGTLDSIVGAFAFVVWDVDPKLKPRKTFLNELRSAGQKHPFLPEPYTDPREQP
jgi:hypothetical protein